MFQGIDFAGAFPINGRLLGEDMMVGFGPTIEPVAKAVRLNEHPVKMTVVDKLREANLKYPEYETQVVDINPNRERWLGESQKIGGWGNNLIQRGPITDMRARTLDELEKARVMQNLGQIQIPEGSDLMSSLPEPVNEPSKVINPPIYELFSDSEKHREEELAKETSMGVIVAGAVAGLAGLYVLTRQNNAMLFQTNFLKFV